MTPAPQVEPVAPHALPAPTPSPDTSAARGPASSRLWLWFVAAFVVQLAIWTTLFVIAHHHPVAEVPLANSPLAP